ncbi:MAG: acyl-CoA dehydrogenase family protein [Caldilineaceae bacterium]
MTTATTSVVNQTPVLSDELLARCHQRAPIYDRENRFFFEDFEELRNAGYLTIAVPTALGGGGMPLAEVCREQRHLAYYAPATAVAINMHLYWTGVAADLWRSGDKSLEWLLKGAVQGEVYAAGHAESGGEIPLFYSTTKAERVDGGYRFTGHKSFGSLTPVWTFMGLHGMETNGNGLDGARIIHAFMPRTAEGYTIKETWDTIGMRATRSDDTLLNGVFVPDQYIARTLPVGFAGADMFALTVFAWFLLSIGNIYYSIARRALDLTLENVKRKTSLTMSRTMDHHAGVQFGIADMVMELETIEPLLEKIAQDWSNGVAHPDWLIKLLTAKCKAVEGAWRVVDTAFELGGGFGIFKKNELERLFRDARLGRIHPANSSLSRELVAKAALGINLDSTPRWG